MGGEVHVVDHIEELDHVDEDLRGMKVRSGLEPRPELHGRMRLALRFALSCADAIARPSRPSPCVYSTPDRNPNPNDLGDGILDHGQDGPEVLLPVVDGEAGADAAGAHVVGTDEEGQNLTIPGLGVRGLD